VIRLSTLAIPLPPLPTAKSWHADWSSQSAVTQLAIVAVFVGLLALLAAVGWGVRRRWLRVRREPL
jgi:hypothetical protein